MTDPSPRDLAALIPRGPLDTEHARQAAERVRAADESGDQDDTDTLDPRALAARVPR